MQFVPGVLKDVEDPRDHLYATVCVDKDIVKGTYPVSLDLRSNLTSIRNQGVRGTCAAFAATAIKEWQEKTDSGYAGQMSPEFIYFFRSNKPNSGMYSRDVMSILLNRGCCTEAELSYSQLDLDGPDKVSDTVIESAKRFCIKEYARVSTIDDLKMALYQNGPCYISFPVYDNSPEFWRQKKGEKSQGGHAVTVVGYDSKGFILRNSWGILFGKKGYVTYPYNEFGVHWDIWTTIDARGSPKPPYKKTCQGCLVC